jgi:predicted amidophosphoribosyltransferase
MLKFEEIDPLADWFAEPACRKERGFNQAELLSKRGGKRLKLPH